MHTHNMFPLMFQFIGGCEIRSFSLVHRKKYLPTLKNVIVALPQVEFVLLVTKDRRTRNG